MNKYKVDHPDPLRNTVKAARRAVCPECGASPGQKCIGAREQARTGCHRGRWNAYRDLLSAPVQGPLQ